MAGEQPPAPPRQFMTAATARKNPKDNIAAAHEAGKQGYPSPAVTSAHNYSDAEMRAWQTGMTVRCEEQYQDLIDETAA